MPFVVEDKSNMALASGATPVVLIDTDCAKAPDSANSRVIMMIRQGTLGLLGCRLLVFIWFELIKLLLDTIDFALKHHRGDRDHQEGAYRDDPEKCFRIQVDAQHAWSCH